jgi:ribosomal protein S18 acetylase RimI-like enzyme/SAM-dependent methyltransferase
LQKLALKSNYSTEAEEKVMVIENPEVSNTSRRTTNGGQEVSSSFFFQQGIIPASQRGIPNALNTDNLQAKLFDHAHRLLKTHETLLRDTERNRKFYEALKQRVTPRCALLDIGAGTGIWAIAAAKLGAARVVAVDMDELLVGVIRMLADEHGVGDRVEAICASSFDLQLDREFDVVVSETIGYLGYDERIVEVMADARKRFLREGGHIIPETVSLHAAAGKLKVRTEPLPVGADFDFGALARLNLNSPRVLKRPRDVTLLTRPTRLISTNLRRAEQTPSLRELTATWDLDELPPRPSGKQGGELPDCVIVWVESRLAPGVNLSTRRKTTSWLPTVYRIEPPSRQAGRLDFSLSLTPESNYWTATFTDGEDREPQSYSPEFAATEMIAAARGGVFTNKRGHVLLANDRQPPSVIELRDVTSDDEKFLCELYHTTRRDEVAAFGWSEAEQHSFLTMQFTMQQQAYKMQYPDAKHSVILFDGEPAGRVIVDRSDDAISLTDIAVLPEFRGRGIASRMISRLQDEVDAIALSVDKINPTARRLYEKHGFTITGETEFNFEMQWLGKTE